MDRKDNQEDWDMKLGVKGRGTTYLKVVASLLIGVMISLSLPVSVGAATFPGANLGSIPDTPLGQCGTPAAPRDVTFVVSGMTAPLGDVRVDMTLSPAHTWAGDLDVTLIAPGGSPTHLIYSLTGNDDSSNIAGPYLFFDTAPAAPTWWTASQGVPGTSDIPAGSYRTSDGSGANTLVTPVFAGLTTAQINGTWTLSFVDFCGGDTGTVSAATLTLTGTTAAGVGVSGRVLTSAEGRGLVGARVTLTDQNGSTRSVTTGKGGTYTFDDLEPGQTYIVSVSSRRFNFQPQVIQVTDNIAELNFVPE